MAKRSSNHRTAKHVGTMVDNLSSGYTINVKPLPPYYKDLVDDRFPLLEYPQRKIVLKSGDVINWPYSPSDDEPMPDEDDPDYGLYMSWKSVDIENLAIMAKRKRAKMDFLLANCVEIVSGPESIEDEQWTYRVEAAFDGYEVPEHPGKRLVVFIKTQVILESHEMEMVLNLCTSPEATMQGIMNALRGFRDNMEQGEHISGNREDAQE